MRFKRLRVVGAVCVLSVGLLAPAARAVGVETLQVDSTAVKQCSTTAQPATDQVQEVDAALKARIDQGLASVGRGPLPTGTVALRISGDGPLIALDATGKELPREDISVPAGEVADRSGISNEIKGIIGACLGVSLDGASGWALVEPFIQELKTVSGAVKFVVRRIGLVAAISCVGGIIWRYI